MSASKFRNFLLSDEGRWYWVIVAITLLSATATFVIPENAFLLVYVRHVLGSLLVLYLPGYCFIKIVFRLNKLQQLERIVLSIGMSILFVFIIGLVLNYTPWGITPIPIIFSLFLLTLVLATIALIKEYKAK